MVSNCLVKIFDVHCLAMSACWTCCVHKKRWTEICPCIISNLSIYGPTCTNHSKHVLVSFTVFEFSMIIIQYIYIKFLLFIYNINRVIKWTQVRCPGFFLNIFFIYFFFFVNYMYIPPFNDWYFLPIPLSSSERKTHQIICLS